MNAALRAKHEKMDAALRAKHEIWRCGESRPAIQSIVTSADFSLRLVVAVTILSSSRMTAAPSDHENRTSSGHQTCLTYVITNPNPSKHEKMDAMRMWRSNGIWQNIAKHYFLFAKISCRAQPAFVSRSAAQHPKGVEAVGSARFELARKAAMTRRLRSRFSEMRRGTGFRVPRGSAQKNQLTNR